MKGERNLCGRVLQHDEGRTISEVCGAIVLHDVEGAEFEVLGSSLLRDLASLVEDVDEVGGESGRLADVRGGLVDAVP